MFINSQGRLLLLFTHEVLAEMNRFPNTAGRWIFFYSSLMMLPLLGTCLKWWVSDSIPFPHVCIHVGKCVPGFLFSSKQQISRALISALSFPRQPSF